MTEKEYLKKVSAFRNSLCAKVKEAEALAKEGASIKGEYSSNDFDGDIHDSHESLGEAFECTCELDLVVTALYCFLERGGKDSENEEDA